MKRTEEEQWQADEQVRYLIDEANDLANDYGDDTLYALVDRLHSLMAQRAHSLESARASIEAWRERNGYHSAGAIDSNDGKEVFLSTMAETTPAVVDDAVHVVS